MESSTVSIGSENVVKMVAVVCHDLANNTYKQMYADDFTSFGAVIIQEFKLCNNYMIIVINAKKKKTSEKRLAGQGSNTGSTERIGREMYLHRTGIQSAVVHHHLWQKIQLKRSHHFKKCFCCTSILKR